MGPLSNAPIDTIKTRLQRQPAEFGQSTMSRIRAITADMIRTEGPKALYKVCALVADCVGLLSLRRRSRRTQADVTTGYNATYHACGARTGCDICSVRAAKDVD
jgi:hypothetical protein